MLRVGVIGYGYWGPNLVRNFMETPGATVGAVSDLRPNRLTECQNRYPAIRVSTDYHTLIEDPTLDAILVSTPVSTHYRLALEAIQAGKHVLVEKPLTSNSDDALHLIEAAEKQRVTLMVDHTFVYTGAVRKIRELVSSGDLGRLYYYDSMRVNLGLFQHDVNVIWDLAVHDLAIMEYVLDVRPYAVSATGMSHVRNQPENIAYMTFLFPGELVGHINVNWLAPLKVRRTMIGGSHKMIVYDDMEPSEKIKVYNKGINVANDPDSVYKLLVSYRAGDMWAPDLDRTEALRHEAVEFIRAVSTGNRPRTDGEVGLHIVQLLEAATASMKENGTLVEIASRKAVAI
jgi:predicted dehydrogenase